MNSTNLPELNSAVDRLEVQAGSDRRILLEEIACTIADAQAALLAGRIQDLELCIIRQKNLCGAWRELEQLPVNFVDANAGNPEMIQAALRVRRQNLLFGAIVRRMRSHLSTLRNLLNGLSQTYHAQPAKVPGREG